MEQRDKATVDLMNLVHDTVGATLSLRAGIENTKREYSEDESLMARMNRMEDCVRRVDKALDEYYLNLKGEKRNK